METKGFDPSVRTNDEPVMARPAAQVLGKEVPAPESVPPPRRRAPVLGALAALILTLASVGLPVLFDRRGATAADEDPAVKAARTLLSVPEPAKPDDERVKAAQKMVEAVRRKEQDLVRASDMGLAAMLVQLQRSIDELKPGNVGTEREVVQSMRKVAVEIKALAKVVGSKEPEYKRQLQLYADELKRSPSVFTSAADVAEQLAREEKITEYGERYRRDAKTLREIGKLFAKRAADLPAEEAEVLKAFEFVRSSERYLQWLYEFLGAWPDFAAGTDRQKLIDELRAYVRNFKALNDAFDTFGKKMVGGLQEQAPAASN